MKRRFESIFNIILILGLIVLLFNDHYLKDIYGNWWTGKMSDFAGVLMLPFIFKFIFKTKTHINILLTILGFTFWKSPMSESFIHLINQNGILHFSRVVDISDLIAFTMLPIAYWGLTNLNKIRIDFNPVFFKSIAQVGVACITLFAFVATSVDEEPFVQISSEDINTACREQPLIAEVGTGNIYIPTIFTPDGNGQNDFFQIVADENIKWLDTFRVWSIDSSELLFEQIELQEITAENGFNGEVNGEIKPFNFFYQVYVTSKFDIKANFSGHVTSIPCFEDMIPTPEFYANCAFADQFDFINGYDSEAEAIEIQACLE